MKFKLDENLGASGARLLEARGHDVATVAGQGLCSTSDLALIEVCRAEGRCLVTLDLDFASPIRFPPRRYAGLAVLRLPARAGRPELHAALETLAAAVEQDVPFGALWVVELDRIRVYAEEPT